MIDENISTSFNRGSDTILFTGVDTPSMAYTALTEAVYTAFGYDEYSMIDVENLPSDACIGRASYDEESGKVCSLILHDWVLEEYGFSV